MYFTPALLITRDGTSTVYPGADGHFLVTRYLKTLPVFPDLLELKIPNPGVADDIVIKLLFKSSDAFQISSIISAINFASQKCMYCKRIATQRVVRSNFILV